MKNISNDDKKAPAHNSLALKLRLLIARSSVFALTALPLSLSIPAVAQQPAIMPRIGFLVAASAAANLARAEAFRQGLHDLGYVEGQNIIIDYRYAEGKFDRLPTLAAELVARNVAVIVSGGAAVTRPAREATTTIPIVMTNDSDPLASGFIASLAHPGGNVTGLATLQSDLSGKRLELLKEIVPKLSRVAVFGSSAIPGNTQALKETELAATALKLQIQYLDVLNSKDIESAFQAASKGRADAAFLLTGPLFVSQRKRLASLAIRRRLPAVYYRPDFVEDGGLMSYAASLTDLSYRAATYVDKILKGAKPADLPVEQPTKFELVINLKTAKQIDLTIPPNVLARADRVIR